VKSNEYGYFPVLLVFDPKNPTKLLANFGIAWPCAGVESLIIYALTILLFLKKSLIPKWQKIVYFVFGAAVTYLINVLRIVSIFLVKINGGDWLLFHNFFGPLYSITWIASYPLIIIGSRFLWNKVKLLIS
jgi:exosortase/archaeosortase family protein